MKYLIAIIIIFICLDSSAQCRYSFEGSTIYKSGVIKKHNQNRKGPKRKNNDGKNGGQITLKVDFQPRNNTLGHQASDDIANGKIYLITFGYPLFRDKEKLSKLRKLTKRYGFQYANIIGCIYTSSEDYNKVVRYYLDKRNGEGWWEEFLAEKSKIMDENIEHVPLYEF